ncbi:MAG: TraB/GumN family protein [Candidatus Woesearchaeota archaeon]
MENENFENYILKYKNLIFFGSSHVSKKGYHIINRIFDNYKIDAVALELDLGRFVALVSDQKPTLFRVFSIMDIIVYFLAKIQYDLAKKIGTDVALDMKLAVKKCITENLPIYLIDQPMSFTLKRLRKHITFRFFIKVIKDFLRGEKIKFLIDDFLDLSYDEIEKVLDLMRKRYPELYTPLLEERNRYMAKKLKNLLNSSETILVIVGKAHVPGILKDLEQLNQKNP